MPNTFRDYYQLLNIDPRADEQMIKEAYRVLARKYHPDVNTDPGALVVMRYLNEARNVLRRKRFEYDRKLALQQKAVGGSLPTFDWLD
jgi:curved DNA-binding protein